MVDSILRGTGIEMKIGRVLSGDKVINSRKSSNELYKLYRGDCVEMESAAISKACQLNNIPLVTIKYISDMADERFEEYMKKYAPKACEKFGSIIRKIDEFLVEGYE